MKKLKNVLFISILIIFAASCSSNMRGGEQKNSAVSMDLESEMMMEEEEQGNVMQKNTNEATPTENSKTWKRSEKQVNASSLFIGDSEQLELQGTQIAIKIDGFRARVLIDAFYFNDNNSQLEGTFKLRLPSGASPYFFAFGETVYLDESDPKNNSNNKLPFFDYQQNTVDFTPSKIMEQRNDNWSNPKEARIVPKEKALFAYGQTVARKTDPMLVEWAGADVFNCRVYPLMPQKLHRIVIGYDLNLINLNKNWIYEFDVPETKTPLTVDLDIADISGVSSIISPNENITKANNRKLAHFENPTTETISVEYKNMQTFALNSNQTDDDQYFTATFNADLPISNNSVEENAILVFDVSLSSNPDKFNIWLKIAEKTLSSNRDAIKNFSVLLFNAEAFWWQEKFVPNTTANVNEFLTYMQNISLQGASDVGLAVSEASNPAWLDNSKNISKNIFLLSDGSATWGEFDNYAISKGINENDKIFAFNIGISGMDMALLEHITRTSGGALFAVTGEDQVASASKAFRYKSWKIENIKLDNASDIIISGRPEFIYPGQQLIIAGRGKVNKNSKLTLSLKQGNTSKNLSVTIKNTVESELAKRVYGQIATNQLEEFNYATEKYSIAYATHFRVPGKTCSFLMLDSEADYQQYGIIPEEMKFAVQSNPVNTVIDKVLNEIGEFLGNAKVAFQNWLQKLTRLDGFQFKIPLSLEAIVESCPEKSFTVKGKGLKCKAHKKENTSSEFLSELYKSRLEYDIIYKEAHSRQSDYGKNDALLILSSLIEKNQGNSVMSRDVAFSALELGLPEQAYFLFRRVLDSRPHEPQTYHAIAQALPQINQIDLAVFYYEIAITASWEARFGEFRLIAALDYLKLLREIEKGKYTVSFPDYVKSRVQTLSSEFANQTADLMITISWNTDNTDIDLHVIEPTGEECFYSHPETRIGGRLTRDVTQGYGPEMYLLNDAKKGNYKIKAKYFSSDANRTSTRTKVYATIYENWGKDNEKITRKVVSLKDGKEMHEIMELKIQK